MANIPNATKKVSIQAKGAVFERLVRGLLEKNGYERVAPDDEQVDHFGRVRGRGEWHQIDAMGRLKFVIPFVYPIRLLCEAKFWDVPADIPVIRNFVGVVKDISENYFVEDNHDIDKRMLSKRYTDCGAIFSLNGFTANAQRYAYAQNIFLVSYENNPIINEFKKAVEDTAQLLKLSSKTNKKAFDSWFESVWANTPIHHDYFNPNDYVSDQNEFSVRVNELKEKIQGIHTSVVGIASGIYPIHLLSYDEIPFELFKASDEVDFSVIYTRTSQSGYFFTIFPSDRPDLRFIFTMPEEILKKYSDSLRRFKIDFLSWIDIPVIIEGRMRRILRFKLDREWLERQYIEQRELAPKNDLLKGGVSANYTEVNQVLQHSNTTSKNSAQTPLSSFGKVAKEKKVEEPQKIYVYENVS